MSRAKDADRKERFADVFAAHFLVPGQKLRELLAQRSVAEVTSSLEAIHLQRYFWVSYATLLNRLREERLLASSRYFAATVRAASRHVSGSRSARRAWPTCGAKAVAARSASARLLAGLRESATPRPQHASPPPSSRAAGRRPLGRRVGSGCSKKVPRVWGGEGPGSAQLSAEGRQGRCSQHHRRAKVRPDTTECRCSAATLGD